jgi:predicted ArsR family transcriptional regulator
MPALHDLVHALSNPTARALLVLLQEGPSHPRALAVRLGLTEGQVQKRLRDLAEADLVRATWRHDGKTVHEYALAATSIRFAFKDGGIVASVEPLLAGVGPVLRAP